MVNSTHCFFYFTVIVFVLCRYFEGRFSVHGFVQIYINVFYLVYIFQNKRTEGEDIKINVSTVHTNFGYFRKSFRNACSVKIAKICTHMTLLVDIKIEQFWKKFPSRKGSKLHWRPTGLWKTWTKYNIPVLRSSGCVHYFSASERDCSDFKPLHSVGSILSDNPAQNNRTITSLLVPCFAHSNFVLLYAII